MTARNKKEHWNRTVLHNCFWKSQVNTGFNGTRKCPEYLVVRIPKDERYLAYAEYAKDPKGHFTASQDDLVVLGECSEEINGTAGHTAAQVLNRCKPDAFKVTAFSDNTAFPLAKHYRLGDDPWTRRLNGTVHRRRL